MKRKIAYLFSLLFLAMCTQEEVTSREYPRVRTLEISDITTSGARFRGTVFYAPGPMIDHGFIWGDLPNLDLNNVEQVSLGPKSGTGDFDATVKRSMVAGKKYYARAYARTDKFQVYGDILTFVSLGSEAPKVAELIPSSGYVLDTILIKGSNFSRINKNVKVSFDTLSAAILSASDSLLRVIVPGELAKASSTVKVSVLGNAGISPTPFQLLGPTLTEVAPLQVMPCDTLVISGSNFSTNINKVGVSLGGHNCAIIALSGTQIKAITPTFSSLNSSVSLEVSSSNVTTTYGTSLTYLAPVIQAVSPLTSLFLKDTLTFSGLNLPLCEPLTITIGTTTVSPLSRSHTSFKAVIPATLTKSSNPLKATFGAGGYVYETTINLAPPKITSVTPTSATFGEVITLTGDFFQASGVGNVVHLGRAPASVLTASRTQLTVEIGNGSADCSQFDACNEVTVFVLDQNTTTGLFSLKKPVITSFDPNLLSSLSVGITLEISGENFSPGSYNNIFLDNTQLTSFYNTPTLIYADVPNSALAGNNPLFSVSRQGTIWVGVGEADPTRPTSLFSNQVQVQIEYLGPWTVLNSYTGDFNGNPTSFTIGSKAYLVGGLDDQNAYSKQVWEYNSATDSWRRLADFPGSGRWRAVAFTHDGLGYYALGNGATGYYKDVWEFDPLSETWTQLADFPGESRTQAFAFTRNGVTYVGGGAGDNIPTDFWAFDAATTKNWEQKLDLPKPFPAGVAFSTNINDCVVYLNELWAYDAATDSWVRLADCPVSVTSNLYLAASLYSTGNIFEGLGGSTTGNFYIYNPFMNSWFVRTSVEDRSLATGFAIGDIFYYGLGARTTGQPPTGLLLTDFYKLDMQYYP